MKRFLITENEKSQILNLYKKFKLNEDVGCPCEDGSVDASCCDETTIQISEKEKKEILAKAQVLKQQEEELKMTKLEIEKKQKIDDIQKKLDQTYNDIMSKPKMDKFQKQVVNTRLKTLEDELKSLQGIPPSSDPNQKSTDQKVSAWVSIASSLLALFTSAMTAFKKDQN